MPLEGGPSVKEALSVKDFSILEEALGVKAASIVEEPLSVKEASIVEEPLSVKEASIVEEVLGVKVASIVEEAMSVKEASIVEEGPCPEEMEARMRELFAFVTKTVEMFKRLEPDGFIDMFKRMEIKYKSTVLNESMLKDTKLGILVSLFEKYLLCRLPRADIKDPAERNAIKFIVESMVSASCNRVQDFTIDDVWKLMITAHTIRTDPTSVMENEMTWFGRIFTLDMFVTQVFRKISYFGEFLYFCTSKSNHEESPLEKVKQTCTEKEHAMIHEIRRNVTPELGIATFVVYRNWIADSFPNTRENMEFWINITESKQGLGYFHDNYRRSLKKIDKHELLTLYLKQFLMFLATESSSAHRYFELCVLNSDEFLKGMRSKRRFMKLFGLHKYLLKILQFYVDVLLYLFDEKENTIDFRELPKFFSSFWNRSNCPCEYVPSYLYEATQLMDFVFVDQFHNKFTEDYYKICVSISDLVIDRFALPHTRQPVIKKYCLLPFFDLKNVE